MRVPKRIGRLLPRGKTVKVWQADQTQQDNKNEK